MAEIPMQAEPQQQPVLETVPVAIGQGRSLSFEVDPAGKGPACFSLGVRKSGSTMLHNIVIFLARRHGTNIVDIPGTASRAGFTVGDWEQADLGAVVRPGNAYTGFRSYPSNLARTEAWREARKIFMFRDPRDALISQYFSDAYSHSLPSAETEEGAKAAEAFLKKRQETLQTDIETYVFKNQRGMQNTLMAYAPLLSDPTCLVLRYEDYVFQKKRLVHRILAQFGWTVAPGPIEALLGRIDKVPEAEEKTNFVRRVIPGDHRAKLSPTAIRRLDNQMREVLSLYDYY